MSSTPNNDARTACQVRQAVRVPPTRGPGGTRTRLGPISFGTADDALFEFGGLRTGQTVLIQAAAGGVGLAAIQLADRAGARVLGTASSDEKL
jgi:NADPH2:quinone reductase